MSLLQTLADELREDPEQIGYADMTPAEAAEAINAETRAYYREIGSDELLAWSGKQGRFRAIESRQNSSDRDVANVCQVLMTMISRPDTKFRPSSADHVAMLDLLVDRRVLTEPEKADLLSRAEAVRSRAEELGLPRVVPHHVYLARQES